MPMAPATVFSMCLWVPYTATVSDPAAYRADVLGMVKVAQRDMLAQVKP